MPIPISPTTAMRDVSVAGGASAGGTALAATLPRRAVLDGARGGPERPMGVVRQLDLVMLVLALPVFLVGGLPLLGYAAGAVAWLVQRAIKAVVEQRAAASEQPRTALALNGVSMIARPWLVALTILPVGVRDNQAGVAAAVLVVVLFTIHLTTFLLLRPLDDASRRAQ